MVPGGLSDAQLALGELTFLAESSRRLFPCGHGEAATSKNLTCSWVGRSKLARRVESIRSARA